ncbi:DNA polymerase III subunit gamma and tau [Paeniglutamicibacter sulfureus]|uniref:DNA-directed DNA polymerase n=1 Tax=Paeniglutamicibacter sulfureus TaxID=43666 RepID=A0ABU2BHQ8_9MICC|nr:DNA polymerase III subunit gamma and tau [Paeniglutamicibacter sulfureus]MDR7358143.1 DNA polymerase-3 subunit gamma/tau [Paeniglutamicibacter sulfureus]
MSTALYRRYRPDNFADVIGQEHVTTPLMTALEKNRVNHAYLFSGPRGCGKTTSARILARCLNCAQGPTPTPCGTCPSCIELASGGPGSLDVIEIDAASHGGVDDARDLRERATFAPVRDRYKIFIIDEAHMVTSAGFNALLKIVEEPPEHIKFIFATTEPDKVIGTIRSRTHHYPFRLVPPEPLIKYLEYLCTAEGVTVAPGVLSLVIRAGGGSVRDSLSVLDQLIAGAGPGGLDYELAVSLLGYTHASLLDDVVDALGAGDAATVFGAVDRVVQTGHDPRRFVEDLLERFRDLIIVRAVPENASQIIRGLPEDQLQRMHAQAAGLGQAELSRWADVTNAGLTEMTGATSPRLHLELLCARLLLPASDATERGFNARMDRVERRLAYAGDDLPPAPSGDGAYAHADGSAGSSGASGYEAENSGAGAAAVREALRAARAQKEGGAPDAPSASEAVSAPPAAQEPTVQPASEPAPESAQPPAPADPVAATASAPAAPTPSVPTQEAPPMEDSTGHSPDWGGTWGPVPDAPANPVTEPVSPVQGTPVQPPANVPPFSILPDRAPETEGEGQSSAPAAEPAPIQQNQAMADFAKKVKEEQAAKDRAAAEQAAAQRAAQEKAAAEQRAAQERAAQERAAAEQRAAQQQQQQQQQQQHAPSQVHQAQRSDAPQQHQAPQQPQQQQPPQSPAPQRQPAPQQQRHAPQQGQGPQQGQAPAGTSGGTGSVEMFRRAWPDILEELKSNKKFVWMMVAPNASVTGFDGRTLTVSFAHTGALTAFTARQENVAILGQSVNRVLGVNVELAIAAGGSAPAGGSGPKVDRRPEPAVTQGPAESAPQQHTAPTPSSAPAPGEPGHGTAPIAATEQDAVPPVSQPAAPRPVVQQEAPRLAAEPVRPVSATEQPVQVSAPSPSAPLSDEDPGFGPEPTWDSEPWDDGGGDWDASSVPVPDWEADLGSASAEPALDTDTAAPLHGAGETSRPAAPAPAAPKGYVAPAPSLGDADRPVAPPPGASAATWGMPIAAPSVASSGEPGAPAASAPVANGGKLSRYQRLMNRAAGIADSAPAPAHARITTDPAAGAWGNPDEAPDFARPRPTAPVEDTRPPAPVAPVELDETEFVPSDDDIAIEDSSLIGVPAIERILNGRVIEERDAAGNVIERPNRPR